MRMDYCGPRGIPYEVFVGEWGELSQQAALDWQARDKTRCSHCGTPTGDWDESRGGNQHAYYAEAYRCLGCEKLQVLTWGDEEGKGMHKRLVPDHDLRMWGGDE